MAKLLVVDDEPVIQHAFRKAFHPPEYETVFARTANEALDRLASDHPDVIIAYALGGWLVLVEIGTELWFRSHEHRTPIVQLNNNYN